MTLDIDPPRSAARASSVGALVVASIGVVVVASCASTSKPSGAAAPSTIGSTRAVFPFCPSGAFSKQLDRLLPPLEEKKTVGMVSAATLDRRLEPGCILPFREDAAHDQVTHVDDVVGFSVDREAKKSGVIVLGRGKLEVGRGRLHVRLVDTSGKPSLTIDLDDHRVHFEGAGDAKFDGEIDLDADDALPLPFDALVAGLEACDDDVRIGMTADGNLVEATRGDSPLWRSRWLNVERTIAVDTSVACGADDTRFAWRSAIGYVVPMYAGASRRSRFTLVLARYTEPSHDILDAPETPARAPEIAPRKK